MIDWTKPVELDGVPLRVLCTDRDGFTGAMPVICLTSKGNVRYFSINGLEPYTLAQVKNTVAKTTNYRPVYRNGNTGAGYKTIAEMKSYRAMPEYIGYMEIQYENDAIVDMVFHKETRHEKG